MVHMLKANPHKMVDMLKSEVMQTRMPCRFGAAIQVQALADVVGCSIVSYHPDIGPLVNRELLHREFTPRIATIKDDFKINIMWSSARTDMPEEFWLPNHVVALLKIANNNFSCCPLW